MCCNGERQCDGEHWFECNRHFTFSTLKLQISFVSFYYQLFCVHYFHETIPNTFIILIGVVSFFQILTLSNASLSHRILCCCRPFIHIAENNRINGWCITFKIRLHVFTCCLHCHKDIEIEIESHLCLISLWMLGQLAKFDLNILCQHRLSDFHIVLLCLVQSLYLPSF